MSIEADVFAGLLATLVDPRTSDDDLAKIVNSMEVNDLRDALMAISASQSGYLLAHHSQSDLALDDFMRRIQQLFRDNLTEAEEETHD